MGSHCYLPDGVTLINSAALGIFCPEGNYYFVRELDVPLIWSRKDGWKKYYEVDRADSHFKSAEDALKAWAAGEP